MPPPLTRWPALGLIISERAGVLTLTAEGLMLIGAVSAIGCSLTIGGYPLLSLAASMLAASFVSLLFAFLVVTLRVNQVISGLAIVFFLRGAVHPARHAVGLAEPAGDRDAGRGDPRPDRGSR